MDYAIISKGLTKKFGRFTAVNDIDLKINTGSIHGFVGPNGAGKTTTIKMLIGAISPSKGTGTIFGNTIGTKDSRQVLGYVPEKVFFYKDLNSIQYLLYMGQQAGLKKDEAIKRAWELLEMFGLTEHAYDKPVNFSSGMKKKIIIAQSLMHRPKILILDEPTANLDPESRMFIIDNLKRLVEEENLTVFISSHILTELELVIDEVTLLENGKIILSGDINEIRNRFKRDIIEISTSNDEILKEYLVSHNLVKTISQNELGYLNVIPNNPAQLKNDINSIMKELNLSLNLFADEFISLDYIYRCVFKKGAETNGNLHA